MDKIADLTGSALPRKDAWNRSPHRACALPMDMTYFVWGIIFAQKLHNFLNLVAPTATSNGLHIKHKSYHVIITTSHKICGPLYRMKHNAQ